MHVPPTIQTNRKPPSPWHPCPDGRPTTRLRPASPGPAPRRGRPAPPRPSLVARAGAEPPGGRAVQWRERAPWAEKEGAGLERGAAPQYAGMRLVAGSRGNQGSFFPPPRPLRPPGLWQEFDRDGCGRTLYFIEMVGSGKEAGDARRRQTGSRSVTGGLCGSALKRRVGHRWLSNSQRMIPESDTGQISQEFDMLVPNNLALSRDVRKQGRG